MPIDDASIAANPGKTVQINDYGTDVVFIDVPVGGGTPTEIDGGNASATGQETIDGGSA
jgi:hypothetical protein